MPQNFKSKLVKEARRKGSLPRYNLGQHLHEPTLPDPLQSLPILVRLIAAILLV